MRNNKLALLILLPVAAAAQNEPCPGFADCLYSPEKTYAYERLTNRVSYTDVAGVTRTVEVTARIPARTGALPVVIWAHGGGDGRNTSGGSVGALSSWAETTAEAGYLSIAPAFHVREPEDQLALCNYLGFPEGDECDGFSALSWDRPFDIKAILDGLAQLNAAPGPLRGRIDLGRVAVGGHSAGSAGTLSVAGAGREFRGKRYDGSTFSDPRPKAFVALSPSAPGLSFMFDRVFNDETTSYSNLTRPVLFVTGKGDAHEQFPHGRRIPYELSPAGDKYRVWVNDVVFSHSAYGDDLDTCGEGVKAKVCAPFRAMIMSTVLAFLDAYVEQRPQAQRYLQNGYMTQVMKGVTLSKK